MPLLSVNPWNSNTFDSLYAVFERDFKSTQPVFKGEPVWFFPELEDGKEVIFWHLTHKKDGETRERLPDPRRAERLPWVRKIIDNADEPEILCWDFNEATGNVNTYLWLKDSDFVVIMKKYRNNSHRLLTSFYIEYPHYRRKLEKKYTQRIK